MAKTQGKSGVMCRLCKQRPVSPARVKAHDYRCWRCRDITPAQKEVRKRYFRTASGRAAQKRTNVKRIYVGRQYHSRVTSVDLARVINSHIKDKRHAFIKGQSDREKTEIAPAGGVPTQTAL